MKSILAKIIAIALLILTLPSSTFAVGDNYNVYDFFTRDELREIASQYSPGETVIIRYTDYDEYGESYVAEFKGTVQSNGDILFDRDLNKKKKKPKKPKQPKYPPVPKKTNGGTIEGDFINKHAFERHKYNPNTKSTSNRTQYGKDVDVKKLKDLTLKKPDNTWTITDKNGKNKRIFYAKEFDGNISTNDTPTRHHRVILNVDQPEKSTQFPLFLKNR